jgi:quercetin dioxygenase-like cupin family protein
MLGVLLAAAAHAQAPAPADAPVSPNLARIADAPIVPVHDEPHHRQLFQYGPTRILEMQVPPGDISWYHTHEWPVLYLTLGQSQTRTQNLGAEAGNAARGAAAAGRGAAPGGGPGAAPGTAPRAGGPGGARAGGAGGGGRGAAGPDGATGPRAFSTTGYIEQPVTHFVENVGTGLFRAMVVINETPGDPDNTTPSAGFAGEPELTNAWFRSYRVRLEPGAAMPAHRHENPVVILQATAGTGRGDGPMDFEFNEPGQWAFYDAGAEHAIANSGDGAIELLEVEVRIAR